MKQLTDLQQYREILKDRDRWVSLNFVIKNFHTSNPTLHKLINQNKVEAIRAHNGYIRVNKNSLENLLNMKIFKEGKVV